MKLAIMQPYFFPYIGYWQLINIVDKFIVYDNIQYEKCVWIQRNRILNNGKDQFITLPIQKDSDYLDIKDRVISEKYIKDYNRILNKLNSAYSKAPYYLSVISLIEECLEYNNYNLFKFVYNSILRIVNFLEIDTEIIISSSINIDHNLKNKYKVMALCKELNADTYINPIGGVGLYDKEEFKSKGIELNFIEPCLNEYKQFNDDFISALSIIDVLMFNSKEEVKLMLDNYTLI